MAHIVHEMDLQAWISDYSRWNISITQSFFNRDSKGKEVVLNITPTYLDELGEKESIGNHESFINLMKMPIKDNSAISLWRFFDTHVWTYETQTNIYRWKDDSEERSNPPYIGLLSFLVLIYAKDMGADTSQFAFYQQLEKLGISRTIPNFLAKLVLLWEALQIWSQQLYQGNLGIFIAKSSENPQERYVSYIKRQLMLNEYSKRVPFL